jgi:hypothetical protein
MRRALILAAFLAAGAVRAFDASPLLQYVTAGSTWTPASLNPVAWYRGDGTANDSGSNAYNGAWTGTNAYTAGVNGQAFYFDSISFLTLPTNINSTVYTLAVWIKPNSVAGGAVVGSADANGYRSAVLLSAGAIAGIYNTGSGNSAKFTTETISTNAWFHVAVSHSNASVMVYINGVYKSVGSATFLSTGTPNTAYIAKNPHVSANPYSGLADDVLIFNRALTQSEITQLYNWRP